MTVTPEVFAGKLDTLADAFTGAQRRVIVERVARRLKVDMAAAVHPKTLSHWGRGKRRGGYTVKARYDMDGDAAVMAPTVKPLAALLQEGSGTEWSGTRRRAGYTRAAVAPRRAWDPAKTAAHDNTTRYVDAEVQRVLRRLFSG